MLPVAALLFLLIGSAGFMPTDPICESRPAACRTVAPFELRIGDKSYPIDIQSTRPWISEGRLTLYPGESVVLNIDEPEKPVVESFAAASAVISDDRATAMAGLLAAGGPYEGAEGYAGLAAGEPLENPSGKRLRLTFRQAPDSNAMILVIENGYDGGLTYDAGMLLLAGQGVRWSATSVCTVQPGIFNMEHWPHAIMAISLGSFALSPLGSDEFLCR